MDGELYEKARDAYIKYAQIEVDSATLVRADMEDLREQAYLVRKREGGGLNYKYTLFHMCTYCVYLVPPPLSHPLPSSLLPISPPPTVPNSTGES